MVRFILILNLFGACAAQPGSLSAPDPSTGVLTATPTGEQIPVPNPTIFGIAKKDTTCSIDVFKYGFS